MERTLHAHGHQVRYRDEGDGPCIVLLHNGGTSGTIWRHQVVALAATHRVVAVDLPGFGSSCTAPGGIDLDGHIAVIEALLDELDAGTVTLVGNCMGATIATRVAAARPDDVAALVLVNPLTTTTIGGGRLGPLVRGATRWPRAARTLTRLTGRLRIAAWVGPWMLRLQLGVTGRSAGLHHDPQLLVLQRRPQQLPALLEVLLDLPRSYTLEYGPVPTHLPTITVVWGQENQVLAAGAADALHERLGVEQPVVLDGCGHLAMLEAPAALTAIIEAAADERTAPATTVEVRG